MSRENYLTIKASGFKSHPPTRNAMEAIIKSSMKDIERKLKTAFLDKKEELKYSLMTNFSIPNTTNAKAQRYIYSSIFSQLMENGFEVKFTHTKKWCYIIISWLNAEDKAEIERQQSIINYVKKNKTSA